MNPSVEALEFNSFRASAIVPSVCWIVGVGDTFTSSGALRSVGFLHSRQIDGEFRPFLESES